MAPELSGLLPRRAISNWNTNEIDCWALGCTVNELLTIEILFMEVVSEEFEIEMSGLETNCDDRMCAQNDIGALKEFCDEKFGLLTDPLRLSGGVKP